ncbi:pseudouridine synthase [Caulobacter henricii]|uniref:Dual-specificity RNA pseudouridine synthase RluF n=1 Tax=Caulobacter henricii TaxID=69395 RepID=A0A0P0NXM2_9CAUL|nr:pseudouridine synthase [Caulobacter henricii]ALL12492.1 pseudouridylate synthase [Caulobacter henricii]
MAFTRTYDEEEPQRVNKWLAQAGVCSRREAEALIADGLVSIDGETVEDVGRKILPGQTLVLADRATDKLDSSLTIMIHKPVGIVSSQPDPGQIPAVRLLKRETLWAHEAIIPNFSNRLAPVGRLDMDSRGLLILSEDGVVAKAVIGPQSELEKEYRVAIMGEITEEKLELMRFGLELDGRELRPAHVEVISDQRLRVILQEGRNRQIRRMCELLEWKVVDLFRVRVGSLTLGDMPEGYWRPLTAEERAGLIAG